MKKKQLNPDKWVDKFADYLFNYTIARVDNIEVAKDIVQDTFFASLKSAKDFRGDASEKTWLTSILKRKIIDHYRKVNSKKGKTEVRYNYNEFNSTENRWLEGHIENNFGANIEDTIENKELGLSIHDCISKLPNTQANVFTMKTIQGMETEDICNKLDITPSNLWVIIHRARTSLVSCLENNWF